MGRKEGMVCRERRGASEGERGGGLARDMLWRGLVAVGSRQAGGRSKGDPEGGRAASIESAVGQEAVVGDSAAQDGDPKHPDEGLELCQRKLHAVVGASEGGEKMRSDEVEQR